ncbi:GATA zinc finger domain-containing protein 1 [Clonorchis sinensis]|uniref:GATA zinc finger domain-containing protein 1 n=1 Tax=Clonorchis sinensis TaxID=79923 RepID=G7YL46_CLOSI|nr:GATA zinc finger domain-containing protein 1 [Clonorchis sinensis]
MPDHHTEGTAKPLSPVAGLRKSLRARVATGTLKSHKTHGSNSGKNSVAKTRSRKHLLKKNVSCSLTLPLSELLSCLANQTVPSLPAYPARAECDSQSLAVDHTGDSCCVLTWLVPTTESISDTFEPENYVIGLEEDVLRDISCCNLVCHCPADYFRPIASPYSIHSY